ncbi:hypothetical protein GWK47_002285 [Chionoecetes opilio]|uniref:Uncharacterized protein n=1 Tax=Chionoecetes opilio TaxID=41210 RepID=A0A8J4XPP5_CHIOP|nr:hypothetical protein GWK47_002285 [Chionoecetes opilio]
MFHILETRPTKVRWCWLARERGTSTASPLVSTVLVLRVATLGGCRNPARCGTPCTCALWNTTSAATSLRCSSESRGLTGSNWAGGSGVGGLQHPQVAGLDDGCCPASESITLRHTEWHRRSGPATVPCPCWASQHTSSRNSCSWFQECRCTSSRAPATVAALHPAWGEGDKTAVSYHLAIQVPWRRPCRAALGAAPAALPLALPLPRCPWRCPCRAALGAAPAAQPLALPLPRCPRRCPCRASPGAAPGAAHAAASAAAPCAALGAAPAAAPTAGRFQCRRSPAVDAAPCCGLCSHGAVSCLPTPRRRLLPPRADSCRPARLLPPDAASCCLTLPPAPRRRHRHRQQCH